MTILRPLSILSVVLLTTTGCTNTDNVQVSSDGKRVAIVGRKFVEDHASDKVKPKYTVMIIESEHGDATTLDLPALTTHAQCLWLDGRLLLFAMEPTPEAIEAQKKWDQITEEAPPPEGSDEHAEKVRIAEKASERLWRVFEATENPLKLRRLDLTIKDLEGLEPDVAFSSFGHPANLAVSRRIPEPRTDIFDAKTLKKTSTLHSFALSAGNGWVFRTIDQTQVERDAELASGQGLNIPRPKNMQDLVREIGAVVVQTKDKTFGIPRAEIAMACNRSARYPTRAAVGEGGRKCFLQFGTETIFRQPTTEYTFGVFDLASGKFEFGGSSNSLDGQPIIKENCVYLLEAKERTKQGESTSYRTGLFRPGVVLARHDKGGRKVVAEIPLGKDDGAFDYAPSPSGDFFILQVFSVEAKRTILLKIPARDSLKPEDIETICPKENDSEQE